MELFDATSVRVDACEGPTTGGSKTAPTRAGNPETDKVTLELKPLTGVIVTVQVVFVPEATATDDGSISRLKASASRLTWSKVETFNTALSWDETASPTVV